ncbi:acetyl-CoA acetyltransferase [Bradyrhizobium algeriense]|uniref:Acetyl-CoA acetyltransferase n=1 Tax=Bradyrhizobium algeriense TaxID=634784 RepID=A0ABU8B3Z8_9BRAD
MIGAALERAKLAPERIDEVFMDNVLPVHALEAQNLKRGVVALCIGGGEATAIAIERVVRG